MSLVVEDGRGLATAESYLGVSDFRSVVTELQLWHLHAAAPTREWFEAVEEDALEAALRRATLYLESEYGDRWVGRRSGPEQALAWPRTTRGLGGYRKGLAYVAGHLRSPLFPYHGVALVPGEVSDGVVPQVVRRATAQIAIRETSRPGALRPDDFGGTIVSESVGGAIGVKYDGARTSVDTIPVVEAMLRPLLKSGAFTFVRRA